MTDKKKRIIYVICAYAFFWIAILLIGIVVLLADDWFGESIFLQILTSIAAWTPTFALLVLFKKLYPNNSIKEFYKNAFRERLKWKMILFTVAVQLLIVFGATGILAFTSGIDFLSSFTLSLPSLGIAFIWASISGATGEQSGWRGFLQPNMEREHGIVKSSIFVGIIWGFWHTPLWFITSGYSGMYLVQFIIAYMVNIVSTAVIIGICYKHCRNLFVPILIHFMFNFSFGRVTAEAHDLLSIFSIMAVIYMFAAIGYVIWHKRRQSFNAEVAK